MYIYKYIYIYIYIYVHNYIYVYMYIYIVARIDKSTKLFYSLAAKDALVRTNHFGVRV